MIEIYNIPLIQIIEMDIAEKLSLGLVAVLIVGACVRVIIFLYKKLESERTSVDKERKELIEEKDRQIKWFEDSVLKNQTSIANSLDKISERMNR